MWALVHNGNIAVCVLCVLHGSPPYWQSYVHVPFDCFLVWVMLCLNIKCDVTDVSLVSTFDVCGSTWEDLKFLFAGMIFVKLCHPFPDLDLSTCFLGNLHQWL